MQDKYFSEGERAKVNDTGDVCVVKERCPVGLSMFYVVTDEDGGRRRVISNTRLRPAPERPRGVH